MKFAFSILCLLPLLAVSSCSEKTVRKHIETSPRKQGEFEKRIESGGFDHKMGKGGMIEMKSDKRSAFEGSVYKSDDQGFDRKQFDGKKFDDSGKAFGKTSWQDAKPYEGNTSVPEFVQKASSVDRQQSGFGDKAYSTSSAQENDHSTARGTDQQFERTTSDYVSHKRDELARPKIISSQEQQAKTIEEIRSMMGRED